MGSVNGLLLLTSFIVSAALGAEKDSSQAKEAQPSRAEVEQRLEAAQRRLDEAAREVADLSISLSDDAIAGVRAFVPRSASRAVLGINIGGKQHESGEGVEVVSVSPGGPAAQAGVQAGDVIVRVNGEALRSDGDRSARQKLLKILREVEPGEKVKIVYKRAGKERTADIVAEERPAPFAMVERFRSDMPHIGIPPLAMLRSRGVFGSAELTPLTPKLAQYFGTDKGLLVVRAPSDSRLQLEDGDVIIDIDGRMPTSAAHAHRILSSYQPGEKLKLNVLRMKKSITIELTVPEDAREKSFDFERTHFNVPVPGPMHDVIVPAPAPVPSPAVPLVAPAPGRDII